MPVISRRLDPRPHRARARVWALDTLGLLACPSGNIEIFDGLPVEFRGRVRGPALVDAVYVVFTFLESRLWDWICARFWGLLDRSKVSAVVGSSKFWWALYIALIYWGPRWPFWKPDYELALLTMFGPSAGGGCSSATPAARRHPTSTTGAGPSRTGSGSSPTETQTSTPNTFGLAVAPIGWS